MATQTFAYTALDTAGVRRSGAVDAETKDAAIARLAAEGRFVLDIREDTRNSVSGTKSQTGDFMTQRPPSKQDLALFTRRLSDLSLAGLPLDRVLHVVSEQSENEMLKKITDAALADVRGGMPVSIALAKYPKQFNQVFTQTLRAGEASGQFGEVASRLADFQELEVTRTQQIISALIYPAVLAFVAFGVIVFLITFVLPKLSDVLLSLGNALPLSTRLLMNGSSLISHYWLQIIITLVVVGVGLRFWLITPAGAEAKDRMLLRAPAIGPVVMKATISRFARVLGTLVYGGVPILEALEIAGLSANNKIFLISAQAVQEEVRAGRPIAEAMRDAGDFPPVLTHMVAVGEETGDLPKMLGRVSDSLDFEVDTGMRRLVSLVEPIIVLVMGSFVGFVVISVLVPIYQSENLVK